MSRPKKHPLVAALEALKRDAKDVEHFISEGDRLEVFFYPPASAPLTPASNNGSPFARPAHVPVSYLANADIDDSKAADAPQEAWDLLEGRN